MNSDARSDAQDLDDEAEEAAAFVRAHASTLLGEGTHHVLMSSPVLVGGSSEQSRVWRVSVAGKPVAVKCHLQPGPGVREGAALREWHGAGLPVPRLLARHEARGWLMLQWLEGEGGETVEKGGVAERRAMHRAAGRFRRELDRLTVPPDDLPLEAAWSVRIAGARKVADAVLSPAVRAQLDRRLNPSVFASCPRRWCHRDFVPRNWIWRAGRHGGEGQLAVCDLGQARPDALESDLLALSREVWPWAHDLVGAFEAGYGASLCSSSHQARLYQAQLAFALASLARACRHGADATESVRVVQDVLSRA